MKFFRNFYSPVVILLAFAVLPACKAKKLVVKTPPPATETKQAPPPPEPAPPPPPTPPPAPAEKPDYNFKNVQFEFNSGVLKTDAYPILDKVVV